MLFEQITGKPFAINGMMDEYVYFYSLLLANNQDCNLDFNDFIDALDENPTLISEFKNLLEDYSKKMSLIDKNDESPEDSKKKL
ncbi:MAG: hypothetical protein MJ245_02965 [Clostridia bacterium]|nr:hypothetical protein [Clostridia bacterium]